MPTGIAGMSGNMPHPKEAILHQDDLLKEKLDMLERKLMQIKDELLGTTPVGADEAPKPESVGFLSIIHNRLHENCVKVDEMNGLANEVVESLVSSNPKTSVVGS